MVRATMQNAFTSRISRPPHYLMKVLTWNCRRVSSTEFIPTARSLLARYNPQVFVVLDTRIQAERAAPIIRRLQFDGSAVSSSIGLAGGMWVLWKNDLVTVHQLHASSRTIHVEVSLRGGIEPFLMSAIHNHPQHHMQNQLWSELCSIASSIDMQWVVLGDFNNISHPHEKIGGN
ncbi:UNVERIFIED_CONTAM: hypothetical protein Sradi_3823900 [Sesamum radiatum]|uniref:Endonuclease/exonuclease/phosphatase domain-containing protein n=1 Tax=Sesamum radiatum TaxID=300843 RepID=A0AAW2Q0R9_SESRA